jgi:hypothetical protein
MRLIGIQTQQVSASAAADEFQQIDDSDAINIEKAWHGLHFLFTGTADNGQEPGCFLLSGGEEIGDEDVGPARVLRPDQVAQFATFLAELTDDELLRRYNPTRMSALEIYPEIWMRPEAPGESGFDYLLESFETLRDFVKTTSARGESLIVSIV